MTTYMYVAGITVNSGRRKGVLWERKLIIDLIIKMI